LFKKLIERAVFVKPVNLFERLIARLKLSSGSVDVVG
jgi:hypothetical protein